MKVFSKLFGTKNEREIKRLKARVSRINAAESKIKSFSDDDFKTKTLELKERVSKGETLDNILEEAFAVCREASIRVLKMRHFDVQLVGGMVLHEGRIAEMRTGEGKTLTATLPVYLNALSGKGVHVVTVNDYLAKRDAEWMGQLYEYLGLSTGIIVHGLSDDERREAYAADVTYGTNNEFGFDFLRDNMKGHIDHLVQREFNYCIIDEVDSILIDEARTPLIISGPTDTNIELYNQVNRAIPGLRNSIDYIIVEKSNSVSLTEDGISKIERRLRIENLYDPKNVHVLHRVEQALKAHFLFKKDVHYVVKNSEIVIIDDHTGREMPGRRYSDGLHGSIEAKEHVEVQRESQTLASITFQNLFRMYPKLSGMTGTADTEAVEFSKIYSLDVVVIPTNKPIARIDQPDVIYLTAKEKFRALVGEIKKAHEKGQPVLVGTASVEKSELVSMLLKKNGVPFEVLNAKNHTREAKIIEKAGQSGNITVSTNMAGRGTDIVLGEGVREAGGLLVIATERHESRRIDNQLRGRAGRQGDPGRTVFYLSLEDDLMRIFASDRLSGMMSKLGMKEDEAIVSPMVSRAIERAQKRVEEQNFGSRKNLLEFDDVMNQQRQVIYKKRNALIREGKNADFIKDAIYDLSESMVEKNSPEMTDTSEWQLKLIEETIKTELNNNIKLKFEGDHQIEKDMIIEQVDKKLSDNYKKKVEIVGEERMNQFERDVYLHTIDMCWKDHLLTMDHLRDSVYLRAHGNRDPLQEYKKEGFTLFERLIYRLEDDAVLTLLRAEIVDKNSTEEVYEQKANVLEDAQFQHADPGSSIGQKPGAQGGRRPPEQQPTNQASGGEDKSQPFVRKNKKIGRNDPCFCGSGKKFKKCHALLGSQTT